MRPRKLTPLHEPLTVNASMSATLIRLGLWTLVLALALYVVHETFETSTLAEATPLPLLYKVIVGAVLLMAAGFVVRMFEKTAKAVAKNRCSVCRAPIPAGAIYCRAHLRNVLEREDDRAHLTRTRK